ncbi:iron-containing alcohol dehydrogenase family protein [Streptomyces tendae]|uniref:iron-containing alcohol dehydrogenase family protein n=1 Tax=Streptomyces tendae TaxID=1932 RepID=UPI0036B89E6C
MSAAPPKTRTFRIGTTVVAGQGSVRLLGAQLAGVDARRVVVVADRGVAEAGLLRRILDAAREIPVRATVLVDPDPDVRTAVQAAETARAARCDTVLAVGGGSALCAAKAVAILLTNEGPLTAYEGVGRVPARPAPCVAVPTTAGSGSEVSNALVLHEPGRDREIIVRGPGCEPAVAVLDGEVLRGLPRTPMLYAALDALTHALEALWAEGGNRITDALAAEAAEQITAVLPRALEDREDAALQQLLEASCTANLACGNSGLGLVHALSASPTVPLPHGYQNGCLLLPVAHFNTPVMRPRHQSLVADVEELFTRIGFPGRFAPGELSASHAQAMVRAARNHPFRTNNRRVSTTRELYELLRAAGADTIATEEKTT